MTLTKERVKASNRKEAPVAAAQRRVPRSSSWSLALTGTLAALEQSGARVVGVTSDREGAGVSLICRELSEAYNSYGRRCQVVAVGDLAAQWAYEPSANGRPGHMRSPSDLAEDFVAYFKEALASNDVVVVDLPPAVDDVGAPTTGFIAAGGACDLVLLVCQPVAMTRTDLGRLVDNCRISKVKIGGVLLNDFNLPSFGLLSG